MRLCNKLKCKQHKQTIYCKLIEDRNSTKLYLFFCRIGAARNLYRKGSLQYSIIYSYALL